MLHRRISRALCLPAIFVGCLYAIPALGIQKQKDNPRKSRSDSNEPNQFTGDEEFGELHGETATLVHALTDRSMPELVEALLSQYPPACHVYVARAYLHAATTAKNPAESARFMDKAADEYRDLLNHEGDHGWLDDDRLKFLGAQARLEWAGMILRYQIAEDLDQYELTSGMTYERERLESRLRKAVMLFAQARQMLDIMQVAMRTQEERFLLLGIGEKIDQLSEECRIDGAWAELYLAMICDRAAQDRGTMLLNALTRFDQTAESARDAGVRYHSLIGAGIALRENGQTREAQAAFARVLDSTAPLSIVARAQYESSKAMIAAGQFDEARKQLEALGRISLDRFKGNDAGGRFYARLAPLLHAYAGIRQSQSPDLTVEQRKALRERTIKELDAAARNDPALKKSAKQYMAQLSPQGASVNEMSETQLSMSAEQLMKEQKYSDAIEPLLMLQEKSSGNVQDQARYNLAVCYFHTGDFAKAGDSFVKGITTSSPDIARRSAEFALRAWVQRAGQTKAPAEYEKLAGAAELFSRTFPKEAAANDAGWIGALARQEAGDFAGAAAAFGMIPVDSPHSYDARRNRAICLQQAIDSSKSDTDRSANSKKAAASWLEAANMAPDENKRKEARVAAANLLISSDVKDFEGAIKSVEPLGQDSEAMNLRFRALRGMGKLEQARDVLRQFLTNGTDDQHNPVLLQWARIVQQEIDRLRKQGRNEQLRQSAEDAVLIDEQLLEWLETRPDYSEYLPVVRISLIEALRATGNDHEAANRAGTFLKQDPGNGSMIYLAASMAQQRADADSKEAKAAAEEAQGLWSKLLQDQQLRDSRPAVYWEARFYWLRYQLRAGRSGEVLKGINAEKAWYPDLGGPPWQARILQLAEEANENADVAKP